MKGPSSTAFAGWSGGEPMQLTKMKIAVTSFKWSPESKSIAFTVTDGPMPDEEKANKEKNDARVVDENIRMSRLYVVAEAPTAPRRRGC